jgi:hypothetical protein
VCGRDMKSLFPDDSETLAIAETRQAEANALPFGSDNDNFKRKRTAIKSFRRQALGFQAN